MDKAVDKEKGRDKSPSQVCIQPRLKKRKQTTNPSPHLKNTKGEKKKKTPPPPKKKVSKHQGKKKKKANKEQTNKTKKDRGGSRQF